MPVPQLELFQVIPGTGLLQGRVEANAIKVPGLLFYEGTHQTALGPKTYSAEDIDRITNLSNDRLNQRRTKCYLNHRIEQESTIGYVAEPFSAQTIATPDQLPFPELFEQLKGKRAIFGTVAITDEDSIESYEAGNLKELSIGIDTYGVYGLQGAIFDVSAVAVQRLPGAALFSVGGDSGDELFALSLGAAMQESMLREKSWSLFDQFRVVMECIENATEEELAGKSRMDLKRNALADYKMVLKRMYGVTDEPKPLPSPTFSAQSGVNKMISSDVSREDLLRQISQQQAQIKAQEDRIAETERFQAEQAKRSRLTATFQELKMKARDLLDKGIVTPHYYQECFSCDGGQILEFFAPGVPDQQVEIAMENLARHQHYLEIKEQFEAQAGQAPLYFGQLSGLTPLPDNSLQRGHGRESSLSDDHIQKMITGGMVTL